MADDALQLCAQQCAERAWRLAFVLIRNGHDAEDVVQESFVVAARRRDRVLLGYDFLVCGAILTFVGTVVYASFVRLWPYNLGLTLRHYRFEVQNGVEPLWTSIEVSLLAAAIGIYLPLELMVPIFLGGVLAHLVERFHKVRADDEAALDQVHRPGVLFSAGLITGEALMGIFIAIPIVVTGDREVLALPEGLQSGAWGELFGLIFLGFVAWLLLRVWRKGHEAK